MRRYGPKVEQGIKYAIAMLEIDAEHIENMVRNVITLEEGAEKPKMSPQDKQMVEEYRAAAEWLRDCVASYHKGVPTDAAPSTDTTEVVRA